MGVGCHSVPSSEFALTVLGECEGLSRLSLDHLEELVDDITSVTPLTGFHHESVA
jgi:hypothetical protein